MSSQAENFDNNAGRQIEDIQIDESLIQQQEQTEAQDLVISSEQQPHEVTRISPLFVDDNGHPMEFFIPDNQEEREQLVSIVIKRGGKISNNPDKGIYISYLSQNHRQAIDPKFISHCDINDELLSIDDYRIYPQAGIYAGNSAEVEAAQTETVRRLVSYLDTPIHEEPTQQQARQQQQQARQSTIHTRNSNDHIEDTVSQTKIGFTKEEDDIILESVRRNPNRRSTHKLFEEIAHKIGRHTGNSVRYRFRKILAKSLDYVYKIDSYGNLILDAAGNPITTTEQGVTVKTKYTAKEDYELCKAVRQNLNERTDLFTPNPKDLILPGKFFENLAQTFPEHSKSSWRDRYRKFALHYGIDKYIAYYENELKEGRVPEVMKNYTGRFLITKRSKTDTDLDEVVGETLSEHNDQFNKTQQKKPTKRRKVAEAEGDTDSSNVFISGDQADLSDLTNSANIFNSHAAAAVAVANIESHPDPDDFLTEDLVTSKFFEFQPLISVVHKIQEIVSRSYQTSDAEALIDAFYAEAGIQKKFGTFIVTAVCGDLSLIPKYIEIFLKTGENPPQNVHGIWTPRDDQYLRSNDPHRLEYLRRLHGERRIELRKDFINQDLV